MNTRVQTQKREVEKTCNTAEDCTWELMCR